MTPNASTTCWPRSRTRGLTLIEVVAAIAILASVLAGVVLAQSRHTDQRLRARLQLEVVQAVDAMITRWWVVPDGVPIDQAGELPGIEGVVWKTSVVGNKDIADLGARVVRVEVFDTSERALRQDDPNEPMFVVDLVVNDPEQEKRERLEEKQAAALRGQQEKQEAEDE